MGNKLIGKSLGKSIKYSEYRKLIKDLIFEGKSTGPNQSEDLLNYSILNDKRMDRLDKKIVINDAFYEGILDENKPLKFLLISEGWCGDAAQVLPIINKIVEASENISLSIVLRDENEDLMNEFLTNGAKAIPKLIILNEKNEVIDTFGPRPSTATKMVQHYKTEHGALDANFKKDLQIWYNKDKGITTQNDILEILEKAR